MDKILAKLSPKNQASGEFCHEEKTLKMTNTEPSPGVIARHVSAMADVMQMDEEVDHGGEEIDKQEVLRLQQELIAANSRIAIQEQELAQTRVIKQTLDQAMGPPSEIDYGGREITEQTLSTIQHAFNTSARPFTTQRQDFWMGQDDSQSDISEPVSASGYNQTRGIWNNANVAAAGYRDYSAAGATNFVHNWGNQLSRQASLMSNQRITSGLASPPFEQAQHFPHGLRRSVTQVNRGASCFPPQTSPWGTFVPGAPSNALPRGGNQQVGVQAGVFNVNPYQPRPIGTPLSPTAAEFTSLSSGTWTPTVSYSTYWHILEYF